jgi:biotin carboxyl carrier protein
MRYLVNGTVVDLPHSEAVVRRSGDRLFVQTADGTFSAVVVQQGDVTHISFRGQQHRIESIQRARAEQTTTHSGELRATMPGLVVDVRATVGQAVRKGETIVVIEAMKTQQPFVAPFDGSVASIRVAKGAQIAENDLLAVVTPS